MKHYDNNIDMFDAYLNGTMSSDDCAVFEKMLSEDKALKQEFKQHKEFLFALQSACGDADAEFEKALKNVSDEEMNSIVSAGKAQTSSLAEVETKPKGKMVPLKSVIRWMSAAAAVLLVVGVGTHLFLGRQSQAPTQSVAGGEDIYNAAIVKNHNFSSTSRSRGGENESEDKFKDAMLMLSNDPTSEGVKILEDLYNNPKTDPQVKYLCEKELPFAYMKNHDIENAKRIINEIKKKYGEIKDPDLKKLDEELSKNK